MFKLPNKKNENELINTEKWLVHGEDQTVMLGLCFF